MHLCLCDCDLHCPGGGRARGRQKGKDLHHPGHPVEPLFRKGDRAYQSLCLCAEGDGAVSCHSGLERGHGGFEEGESWRHLIPEVSSNLGYALPGAEGIEDVAAFPGRIVRFKDTVASLGDPEFGASQPCCQDHSDRHAFRSRILFGHEYPILEGDHCRIEDGKGLLIGHFDRRQEPKKVKEKEGSSLEWGVHEVLSRLKKVPDFIYDEGDVGKEPMIRVLGRNPQEVVKKVLKAVGS